MSASCDSEWLSWDAYYCQDGHETYARAAHSQYGPSAGDCSSMARPIAVYADRSSAGILNQAATKEITIEVR